MTDGKVRVRGSVVVHAPTIPKVRGSNPRGAVTGYQPLGQCGCGSCISFK